MESNIYIDINGRMLTREEALQQLKTDNDLKFLTQEGIVEIDHLRWKKAQEYELVMWRDRGNSLSDDRNYEHFSRFNTYSVMKGMPFNRAIELGCGPFTNIRLLPDLNVKEISLLDPLITEYLNLNNCSYKTGFLSGKRVHTIASSIEDFVTDSKFDLVFMINVLEHCRSVRKVFDKILSLCDTGGILVLSEWTFNRDGIEEFIKNIYDAGHPIRLLNNVLDDFLRDNFVELHRNMLYGLYDQEYRRDVYFIGKRK